MMLFLQAQPLNALADILNPLPTAQELSAAVALTGLSDDAPGYRSGMAPSRSMSALQMAGWIEEFQDGKLAYIMDTFENYDVELAYLKENYPVTFDLLKGFSEAGIGRLYDEYSRAMAWRDEVKYYYDLLVNTASQIFVLAESLQKDGMTEREQAVAAYKIRDKWHTLNTLLTETVDCAKVWEEEYDRLLPLLTGDYAYSGSDDSLAWLLEEVDHLREMDGRTSAKSLTVSASAVRVAPDQTLMTRLARLSPISSALADSEQTMSVMVLDDQSFFIGALDGAAPLSGVSITVSAEKVSAETKTTNSSGYISMPMRSFPCNKDGEAKINLAVSRNGYRKVEAPGVWVMKGGSLKVPMQKDTGDPYPVSWTFWGNDMLVADYEVVISPFNDSEQNISVTISSPKDYSFKMYFTDKNGKNPVTVGEGSGGEGDKLFSFKGLWLKKAPGDGKLYLEIKPQGGSTITYQARVKLIPAKVQNPIGDPNFKLLMNPGIQFTLPKDWAKPLGGLVISIETPLDKLFKIRAYIDLNGNGAITVGTTAFDDKVKAMNDGMWKSQDKKALDKAVKDAEEKGMMAKAKAANGGDWAGREKYKPLALGSISVSMSWFGFIQGQVRQTEDGNKEIRGKGGAGFTLNITGEAGLQWPFVNLSLTAAAYATIFPEVALLIDVYWPDGQTLPSVQTSKYVLGSLNFILRIELGLTLCVGLKGVVSVSITGLGFLEFQFRVSLGGFVDPDHWQPGQGDADMDLKLYGGAMFRVVLEILWIKTMYYPFGPEWKWRLIPGPIERVESKAPKTMVDRFVAFLASSASAEEEDGEVQGGLQVDTDNDDLILEANEIRYQNQGASKNSLFSMRPSGTATTSDPIPMMFYIKPERNNRGNLQFDRPVLLGVTLSYSAESPIAKTEEGLDENGWGIYTDGGWDVIDYSYWVQDVSRADVYSYDRGVQKKLTDVVFVVTIQAKEYEEQRRTLSDGTVETRTVPVETWANVHCYYLDEISYRVFALRPVVLSPGGKYLAELYGTNCFLNEPNPCGNPRIYGNIIRSQDSAITFFRVVASPLNIDTSGERDARCFQVFTGLREDGSEFRQTERMENTDDFFENRMYEDFCFFDVSDNSMIYNFAPNKAMIGLSTEYYTLVRDAKSADGLYSLGFDNGYTGTYVCARNVLSIAPRRTAGGDKRSMIFMVQQNDGDEGFRVKGLCPDPTTPRIKNWTIWDYGVDVPPVNIYWANLYGRECLYWAETAGETEDGRGQLFKVRGMWYDDVSNTLSEPFVLAVIKTPLNSTPSDIILNGSNSGYYILEQADGRRTAHQFNFQMVVGLKMVGNILSETLVTPGTYDDMLLTVYNNGNVPLSGLDLTAYDVKQGGAPQAFETVHLDVINPYNNRVTLNKGLDGGKEDKQGVTVARQEECSLNDPDSQFWLVKETTHRASLSNVTAENSSLQKTNLIMPGTFAAFNISLMVPQGWSNAHDIYLQVEKLYTTADSSFSNDVNTPALLQAMGGPAVISVGRDGAVRKEGGGLLRAAADDTDYSAIFKTDLTFDRILLSHDPVDLEILARRWDTSDGTPMVTLTVNNQAYIASGKSGENVVVMEAFLDDEITPVFRYILPEEVSDKATWNFDLPLALLCDGRSASRVTVKVAGRNYQENGDFDNSAVIYLDTENLMIIRQPEDQTVPEGGEAVFSAAAAGGRAPLCYQWQVYTKAGKWVDIAGATGNTLRLNAVILEMSGNPYRLTVTDTAGYTVTTRAASLTVKEVPLTGDTEPILWYALGIAVSVGAIAWILLRKKKENE